jgi:hypothetical protein
MTSDWQGRSPNVAHCSPLFLGGPPEFRLTVHGPQGILFGPRPGDAMPFFTEQRAGNGGLAKRLPHDIEAHVPEGATGIANERPQFLLRLPLALVRRWRFGTCVTGAVTLPLLPARHPPPPRPSGGLILPWVWPPA